MRALVLAFLVALGACTAPTLEAFGAREAHAFDADLVTELAESAPPSVGADRRSAARYLAGGFARLPVEAEPRADWIIARDRARPPPGCDRERRPARARLPGRRTPRLRVDGAEDR